MRRSAIALVAVGASVIAAVALLVQGGGTTHHVRAAFDAAQNAIPGLEVRVAGRPVGSIASVRTDGGHAVVAMELSDDRVWPLHSGTTARLRYGPTAGYAVRYVELHPGPATAAPLPDNALLPLSKTDAPAEVDDLLRILDRPGRRAARAFARNAGTTLRGQGPPLAATLAGGAPAMERLAELMDDLRRARGELATLVTASSKVTGVLARRERSLQEAVRGLAGTYDEIAGHRVAAAATLRALPGTLRRARQTLARSDASVARLDTVATALGPAALQIRRTAPVLRQALAAIDRTAPLATGALRAVRRGEPALSQLLSTAPPVLDDLRVVLTRAEPMLACVRPYAPELAGVLSTWAGYAADYDALGHVVRAELQVSPSIYNHAPITPAQFVGLVPDTTYALPRAPGANAGQPWFQPQCGATEAATDPRNDPETRP